MPIGWGRVLCLLRLRGGVVCEGLPRGVVVEQCGVVREKRQH